MQTFLTYDQGLYARDALAKAIYDRLFTWIVRSINRSLEMMVRKHLDGCVAVMSFTYSR